MEKPPLHVVIIGIIAFSSILIATLIMATFYGISLFDEEQLTLISAVILIILVISTPIILYQLNLKPEKPTISTVPSKVRKRMLEFGIAFGVLIDDSMKLFAKSDRFSLPDHYIKSLLEYSAVLYMQGKLDQLYGPFPVDSQLMIRTGDILQNDLPAINYFSFGFKFHTRENHKNTSPLAILLITYPKEVESRIIDRKEVFTSYLEKLKIRFENFNKLAGNIETLQNEILLLSLL
ncbi:MAG: hypothetical protein ACFFFG_07765 [Candidatus Thorarchaeota archaeon]